MAIACSGVTISAIANSGPTTMTESGAGCPASVANTSTTAAIGVLTGANPGAVLTSIPVASSAGFVVGDLISVADALNYETETVASIPDSTHVQALVRKPHATGALVYDGGAAGDVVCLSADTFSTTGQFGVFNVQNPVPQCWPLIGSDATHLFAYIAGVGQWDSYVGQAATSAASDAFSVYPAAEVADVSNNTGHITDTFNLAPNTVAWAAGDGVQLPPYPYAKTTWGHYYYAKTYPTPGHQGGGLNLVYAGIWNGADAGFGLYNQTPASMYNKDGNTGFLVPPTALNISGLWSRGIHFDHASYGGYLIGDYDNQNAAGGSVAFLAATNASGGVDTVTYNTSTTYKLWYITAGSNSIQWRFYPSGLSQYGSSPTVSSCGTSPTISASNIGGTVTIGIGGTTSCVITFSPAFGVAPSCTVTEEDGGTAPAYAVSPTGISVTFASSKSSIKWDWTCAGHG